MDFIRYAEAAASLLNADLSEVDGLVAYLDDRPRLQERAIDRDCMVLRKLQRELRPVFDAGEAGDLGGVVRGLNGLLSRHPITPQISDHDGQHLHLHVAAGSGSVAEQVVGESLLGLATLICDLGADRLGVCSSAPCTNAFVDASPNRSRRYCSERCSSRANVAAYRARRRASATA
ncbi:CGNR zinc finger domain-containing protein [Nocardioides sp. YIM 152315]|uniref:CGNR zinc finger domain-containing protein n=1 Tax=Nocardioides sp. YIM 152315 TaxID=3031760 RepID=UPI0023DC8A8C|nr:CGNR zinc finger domain-containing protein [Nocardioides sp. YIM 152315]MDF1604833.1 CGNR zinc finger domain-containing protein [Nocardioides sp. YIM 152315]